MHERPTMGRLQHILLTVVCLALIFKAVQVDGRSGRKSKKYKSEIDQNLKKFMCVGFENQKKSKHRAIFKEALRLAETKNFGDALTCAIHAARLRPTLALKEWEFAVELLNRIQSP